MIEAAEEMIWQEEMEIEARLEHEEWYAEADPYTKSEISRIDIEREAAQVAAIEAARAAEEAETARLDAERLAGEEQSKRIVAEKAALAAVEAEKARIKAERLAAEEKGKRIAAEKAALAAGVEAERLPSRRVQRDGMNEMEGFRDTHRRFKSAYSMTGKDFGSMFMD